MDWKQLREDAGLTAAEAARRLGIAQNTLWRYENGKTKRQDARVVDGMRELYAPKAAAS